MRETAANIKKIKTDPHLEDIFSGSGYLELGIINVKTMARLLKYELVNIDEITYFPIQNKGLGRVRLRDPFLRNYLPFHFFRHCAENNGNIRLFITYGLFCYRNTKNRETFMPVILLPVEIHYENGDLLVQMIAPPTENPALYKAVASPRISFLQTQDFGNIYALDAALVALGKLSASSVRLDNYLTFAILRDKDIILSYTGRRPTLFGTEMIWNPFRFGFRREGFVYSDLVLNKTQRETLKRLCDGESLNITGYNGTGKTTVLRNFIVNNIARNRKTVYLSDSSESIKKMKEFIDRLMLGNYAADLTTSFRKLTDAQETDSRYVPTDDCRPLRKQLEGYHENLERYEKAMNLSICGFRFIEIINSNYLIDRDAAARIADGSVVIADFEGIYKHEYEEITNVLTEIERGFTKIGFRNSIWKEIPIINNIGHVDEVIDVVSRLNEGLMKLREYEIDFGNHGIRTISGFSEMKTVISPLHKLDEELIPEGWKTSISLFEAARTAFNDLKRDVEACSKQKIYLHAKYRQPEEINIDKMIESLYGAYYRSEDLDVVRSLLRNRQETERIIELSEIDTADFHRIAKELIGIFNRDFLKKEEYIEEIFRLADLFEKNYISGKTIRMISNNRMKTNIRELNLLDGNIRRLTDEIDAMKNSAGKKIKDDLLPAYETKQKKLKKAIRDYRDLCDFGYENHKDNIASIIALKTYYDQISKKKYKKTIIDFLQTLDENSYTDMLMLLRSFVKVNRHIKDSVEYFKKYGIDFGNIKIGEIVAEYEKYRSYLKELYASDRIMRLAVIAETGEFADPERYFEMKEDLDCYYAITASLSENKRFKKLYGRLYKAKETDVSATKKAIEMFDEYRKVFIGEENVYDSFRCEGRKTAADEAYELVNEIGENLRLYSLIFKDSVSRYYFSNIETNVAYLTSLLEARDELQIYLGITRGIGILNNYHLTSVIKFIEENDDVRGIAAKFGEVYFHGIINMFTDKYPFLKETKAYIDTLNKTIILEDVICRQRGTGFVNGILKNVSDDFRKRKLKNGDYPAFFRSNRNRIEIYLGFRNFFTRYYRNIDYETIIIDDAHMLRTGEYNNLFRGKQVVICGDYQSNTIVNQNLLTLASMTDRVVFKHRYFPAPRGLTRYLSPMQAPHRKMFSENTGVRVIGDKLEDLIFNLCMEDRNVRINYFIGSINSRKKAYEAISRSFYKNNVTSDEIIQILNNNIRICDIGDFNYLTADYNILGLKDYRTENSPILARDMFEVLLTAGNELIIHDPDNCLEQKNDYEFIRLIKNLTTQTEIFPGRGTSDIDNAIAEALEKKGFKVFFPGNGIDMLLQKPGSDELKGLLILYNGGNITEVLEFYRDFYDQYIKNGHKVIVRTLVDLLDGSDVFTNGIVDEFDS